MHPRCSPDAPGKEADRPAPDRPPAAQPASVPDPAISTPISSRRPLPCTVKATISALEWTRPRARTFRCLARARDMGTHLPGARCGRPRPGRRASRLEPRLQLCDRPRSPNVARGSSATAGIGPILSCGRDKHHGPFVCESRSTGVHRVNYRDGHGVILRRVPGRVRDAGRLTASDPIGPASLPTCDAW